MARTRDLSVKEHDAPLPARAAFPAVSAEMQDTWTPSLAPQQLRLTVVTETGPGSGNGSVPSARGIDDNLKRSSPDGTETPPVLFHQSCARLSSGDGYGALTMTVANNAVGANLKQASGSLKPQILGEEATTTSASGTIRESASRLTTGNRLALAGAGTSVATATATAGAAQVRSGLRVVWFNLNLASSSSSLKLYSKSGSG